MNEIITRQYDVTKKGVRYTVELRIDVDAVALDMVNNAARNTSGKATQMGRNIIAKVVDKVAVAGSASLSKS